MERKRNLIHQSSQKIEKMGSVPDSEDAVLSDHRFRRKQVVLPSQVEHVSAAYEKFSWKRRGGYLFTGYYELGKKHSQIHDPDEEEQGRGEEVEASDEHVQRGRIKFAVDDAGQDGDQGFG